MKLLNFVRAGQLQQKLAVKVEVIAYVEQTYTDDWSRVHFIGGGSVEVAGSFEYVLSLLEEASQS